VPQVVIVEKKSLMTEAEQQSKKTNMLKEVVSKGIIIRTRERPWLYTESQGNHDLFVIKQFGSSSNASNINSGGDRSQSQLGNHPS
jgi:hypothetical protein